MCLNQYKVKAYVKGFNQLKVPQTILDCEFNLDFDKQRYFASTVVFANSGNEAQKKGMERINLVIGMFEVYIIYHFEIYDVFVEQISGEEPFIHSSSFVVQRDRILPFP